MLNWLVLVCLKSLLTSSSGSLPSRTSSRCIQHSHCDCLVTAHRRFDVVLNSLEDVPEFTLVAQLQDAQPDVKVFVFRSLSAEKYVIYGFNSDHQRTFTQTYTSLTLSLTSCSTLSVVYDGSLLPIECPWLIHESVLPSHTKPPLMGSLLV
eukprot:GHVR01044589.1.p1 GENE.GHVR01044589.1~~GHVR01044589.1.p1  ORF type:complete len:151 (-),score=2.51 GHVR01044589.1:174-626(-)